MPSKIDAKHLCLNLRCKQMFYKVADSEADAHDKEVERLFGPCDTTTYWCECTQTGRGPDEQPVGKGECSPSRKCYQGIHAIT